MEFWKGAFAFVAVLVFAVTWICRHPRFLRTVSRGESGSGVPFSKDSQEKDPYTVITPLPNFDWRKTEPLKLRPFKPKYHLTMGKKPISYKYSLCFSR